MEYSITPIIIVGVQRSGTTLIATLLGNHPAVYHEKQSQSFRLVTWKRYISGLRTSNQSLSWEDFLIRSISNDKGNRLEHFLSIKDDVASISSNIQFSLSKRISKNQRYWLDKCPNLEQYTADIFALYPNAKVIHMVRDARATSYSMNRRVKKNIRLAAQIWLEGTISAQINESIYGPSKYMICSYEELVSQPDRTVEKIGQFLGIELDSTQLTARNNQSNEDLQYVKSNFQPEKINTWKSGLKMSQVIKIERIAGPTMHSMGYSLVNPQYSDNAHPLSVSRKIILNLLEATKRVFSTPSEGMRKGQMVKMKHSYKNGLYLFLQTLIRELLSVKIFQSLFSRAFYDKNQLK